MSPNYYTILGVEKSASEKEIKTAFRALAHKHHPDKGGDEKKFKEINEAYQTLSNKEKRASYDRFGNTSFNGFGAGQGASGFSANGGPAQGWNMNYGNFANDTRGSQFKVPNFTKIPIWISFLLLPIIIIVMVIGLIVLFFWISFRALQTVLK